MSPVRYDHSTHPASPHLSSRIRTNPPHIAIASDTAKALRFVQLNVQALAKGRFFGSCAKNLVVVNAAPGCQLPVTTECSNAAQAQLFPPFSKYLIANVESGGLLFEGTSGTLLVDFRRTGGRGNRTLWEIRDVSGPGERSTIWNVGTGHPISLNDEFTEAGQHKATEFIVKSAGYPFFKFEAPVSRKLWDINYEGEGRYPEYAHLTLAKAPTENDRIAIFWKLQFPPEELA
ncbi:hypothetical protein B0H16DRAFT_1735639 [Mycena metata]|uniref:Uncharacterized protein n=1 Tax=Mycena metata TaxID=1033252 RepID=A0AAD7MP62_9AGAR|nr:hypothetical protein B0H16DRAFT_1735639 [Mycena metata]